MDLGNNPKFRKYFMKKKFIKALFIIEKDQNLLFHQKGKNTYDIYLYNRILWTHKKYSV